MVALLLLSAALFFASVGLAVRMRYPKRSETMLAAGVFGSGLLLVPVYGLGLLGQLYRGTLILASAAVFLIALGASFLKTDVRAQVRSILTTTLQMIRLPWDGLRILGRDRGPALVGGIAVLLIVVWSGIASYAAASDSWDGIGYHEPIIGYTIQDHGMTRKAVVQRLVFLEAINGNPRHSEMTSLWLVLLWDRRLIELPTTLTAPIYLLAFYLLCRRVGVEASSSIGWACAAILMPGAVLLFRSTYIDLHVAAFSLSALYLCSRAGFRLRDAWPAAVAVGLMIGGKVTNLAWGPPLGLVALALLGRELWHSKGRRGRILAVMIGATALAAALGGVLYIRNLVLFKSPLWPFGLDIKSLGIHFPGVQSSLEAAQEQHKPLKQVWEAMTGVFEPKFDYADTRVFGYGWALPFVLLPLGALSLVQLLVDLVALLKARFFGKPSSERGSLYASTYVACWGLLCAYFSPGLWQARYNLPVAAVLMIGCARLGTRWGLSRLATGALAFTTLSHLLQLYWSVPGLQPKPGQLIELLKLPAEERAARRMNPWTLDDSVARARDTNLKPGDLLVYTDGFLFVGPMWNEKYTNRIEWWPTRAPALMLPDLEQSGARWVIAATSSALANALSASPHWRRVGRFCHQSTAFERVYP